MSTGGNDPNKCRWCGMFHGPQCPALKAIEFFEDGVTVKRVEYKTGNDYPPLVAGQATATWPWHAPQVPTRTSGAGNQ